MTVVLANFLLVSTPILGVALLLAQIYRRSLSRDWILRCAVFGSAAGTALRLFLAHGRPAGAAIVIRTDRVPADVIGISWISVAVVLLAALLIRQAMFARRLFGAPVLERGAWVESLRVLQGGSARGWLSSRTRLRRRSASAARSAFPHGCCGVSMMRND